MSGYDYEKNPYPEGHRLNPRKPKKFVYIVDSMVMGGRQGEVFNHRGDRVFTSREDAMAYAQNRVEASATSAFVQEIPVDWVEVDDSEG